MPSSSVNGKKWIGEQLTKIVSMGNVAQVLDIGAGQGTYRTQFRDVITHATWTAVEVWQPYVDQYNLNELYDCVIVQDARTVDYAGLPQADIAFAGDVLEHMTKEQSIALVNTILQHSRCLIASIPIVYMPQGEHEGNPYEEHVKPDWSDREVYETFGASIVNGAVDQEIGVYVLSQDPEFIAQTQYTITPGCENKIYSQNGEDGIIDYIFSKIGTTNKIAVEFGIGDGWETNTRNLAHHDWTTFWFDSLAIDTVPPGCTFTNQLLTANNIVPAFDAQHIPKEFDLLSIDVDGNDYHLRQALHEYRPRVCVMEYNGSHAPDVEYIMPRRDDYCWKLWELDFGASLLSLTKQANSLGYDLVYCDQRGVNAFFVRRDVNVFAPQTPEQAYVKLWWADQI